MRRLAVGTPAVGTLLNSATINTKPFDEKLLQFTPTGDPL